MTRRPSVCPLDCPDRCSLEAEIVDGRVAALHGTRANPLTDGVICGKVRGFARRVHGPERILSPMRRAGPKGPGGSWSPVSWDEALDELVARWKAILASDGPEALLPVWYAGSNGYLTGGGLDARLWAALGTTELARTLCAANTGAGVRSTYGDLPSTDPADVDHADGLLLWGANPNASGIHLVPKVNALLKRGGALIVVDPRRTPLAARAHLHVAPLPGTDVALALGVAHLAFRDGRADRAFLARHTADADVFEAAAGAWTPARVARTCGIDEAAIHALAERYGGPGRWLLRCGWGVERTRNGTDAIRSILALPAVFGKFGARGSGWALSTSSGYRTDKDRLFPANPGRKRNLAQLGRVLLEERDPPIRACYVYDCNPVATVPDQRRVVAGLSREDLFTVVHEQAWTDTCDYADLVLPATTFLEHRELTRSYGGYVLQWAEPALPPVGEARANPGLFSELAARLGLDAPGLRESEEELARAVVEATRLAPPGSWERLRAERVVALPSPIQFVDAFPSAPIRLAAEGPPTFREPPADADRPLVLVSPASTRGISSTLFETLPEGAATVALHPADAGARGLVEGQEVRVANSVGEAVLRLAVDDSLRPGVCLVPKGVWRRSTRNGWTGNALVPDHVDDRGGGCCYNDARVEVTAC